MVMLDIYICKWIWKDKPPHKPYCGKHTICPTRIGGVWLTWSSSVNETRANRLLEGLVDSRYISVGGPLRPVDGRASQQLTSVHDWLPCKSPFTFVLASRLIPFRGNLRPQQSNQLNFGSILIRAQRDRKAAFDSQSAHSISHLLPS